MPDFPISALSTAAAAARTLRLCAIVALTAGGALVLPAAAAAQPSLAWAPPGYPDYAGYTTVYASDANSAPALDPATDYRIVLPDVPMTKTLRLVNGRNIVVIGGDIDVTAHPRTTTLVAPVAASDA